MPDCFLGQPNLRYDFTRSIDKIPTSSSEPDARRAANKQRTIKLTFKFSNLPTDGRFLDPESRGCLSQASVFGCSDNKFDLAQLNRHYTTPERDKDPALRCGKTAMPTIDNRQDTCRFIRVNHLLWDQAELLGEFMSHRLSHSLSRLVGRQHKRLIDVCVSLGSPYPAWPSNCGWSAPRSSDRWPHSRTCAGALGALCR